MHQLINMDAGLLSKELGVLLCFNFSYFERKPKFWRIGETLPVMPNMMEK